MLCTKLVLNQIGFEEPILKVNYYAQRTYILITDSVQLLKKKNLNFADPYQRLNLRMPHTKHSSIFECCSSCQHLVAPSPKTSTKFLLPLPNNLSFRKACERLSTLLVVACTWKLKTQKTQYKLNMLIN